MDTGATLCLLAMLTARIRRRRMAAAIAHKRRCWLVATMLTQDKDQAKGYGCKTKPASHFSWADHMNEPAVPVRLQA